MSKFTENPVWEDGIYRMATEDRLIAGPPSFDPDGEATGGFLVAGEQQLTNRTAYLKQEQDTIKDKLDTIENGAQVNTVTSVAGKTGAVTLTKSDVGLANVDNTSDANKPVSTAQQTALNLKADLASPALTGIPTTPTAAAGTNTTQIASTAFANTAAINAAATKADLNSPTFTGTPSAPTATAGTNTTQLATTAFVTTAVAPKANLASPAFTGTPTAPTATQGNNSTQLATTAYVDTLGATKANLASPAFTGVPTAPTAAAGTNTTQIATTAFVLANSASNTQQYASIQDQKASGTSGGTSVSGSWLARDLNTIVESNITGLSLASNSIQLPAGTYYAEASSAFLNVTGRLRIYNNTDATTLALGFNEYSNSGASPLTRCTASGKFTLSGTKTISLQYRAASNTGGGLGTAYGYGENEIYSEIRIWKLS